MSFEVKAFLSGLNIPESLRKKLLGDGVLDSLLTRPTSEGTVRAYLDHFLAGEAADEATHVADAVRITCEALAQAGRFLADPVMGVADASGEDASRNTGAENSVDRELPSPSDKRYRPGYVTSDGLPNASENVAIILNMLSRLNADQLDDFFADAGEKFPRHVRYGASHAPAQPSDAKVRQLTTKAQQAARKLPSAESKFKSQIREYEHTRAHSNFTPEEFYAQRLEPELRRWGNALLEIEGLLRDTDRLEPTSDHVMALAEVWTRYDKSAARYATLSNLEALAGLMRRLEAAHRPLRGNRDGKV